MHRLLTALTVLALALAGCLGATSDDPSPAATTTDPASEPPAPPAHVLVGASEPAGVEAPTFRLLGAIAEGGPVYGAGEPSIWAHLDGTVYLAFPGCDEASTPIFRVRGVTPECEHGPVYRSDDGGETWTRLNDDATGRLADDGPRANGDNDVAVDAAGVVYASNLGGGIQVYKSETRGGNWSYVGDVVPEDHWADRQWMAAGKPGHLIMAWMGGADRSQRAVAVNTTWDGGETWSGVQYLGESIGWLGTVQFDPSAERAFLPFTMPKGGVTLTADAYTLHVARTLDGGASWDVVDTGVAVDVSDTGWHWSGTLMAPAIDVTGDGTVAVAWSEEDVDATGLSSTGATVKLVASKDWGETWGEPVTVSERASAIMPWVTGGAGDRLAVTYFASDVPLDTDYAGYWDVMAAVVDGAGGGNATVARTVLDEGVHAGGLCARGGLCLITASDRALLDFFESDLLPDGRLVVTYPADLNAAKMIEIRVAVQDGGAPLAVWPGANR